MIKSILNTTKVLSKSEQRAVKGGSPGGGTGPVCVRACCKTDPSCPRNCWGGPCY